MLEKSGKKMLSGWIIIMTIFWSGFWLFNGLDKFMDGEFQPMMNAGVTQGVLVDTASGDITHALQPMHTIGLFGKNRNTKTGIFFTRVGLSPESGEAALVVIGIVEILLGLLFLAGLGCIIFNGKYRFQLFSFGLLVSFGIFTAFTVGDIFFGERMELWEHTTFMILIMVSYYMYSNMISSRESYQNQLD